MNINEIIEKHGYAVQGVFSNSDDETNFAYTVGLSNVLGYELIANGFISIQTFHLVINNYIKDIQERKLPLGSIIEDAHICDIIVSAPVRESIKNNIVNGKIPDGVADAIDKIINDEETVSLRYVLKKQGLGILNTHIFVRSGEVKDVYQIIIADKNNKLPGEEGYTESLMQTIETI